ncbi:choline dehydrogenase [Iodidimonas gelatinilytica]|uniref:Choline dehydrogenase n=1 Tax=Iodidimonas gelatinilytica TaxID=1236966 RepID=A0A5A7MY91_9PROT|nr:GMC family oxidoreductase N-terminal domain-containing protein [Iodidimonas gelatinilytica]GER00808.1 choline dehydrogenase [Iodidimonas gelatinilytica]
MEAFDFIIVGAGSAGCVLANRLSENPDHRVLLLEAGPKDSNPFIHMPLGYAMTLKSTTLNWQFPTLPDPHTHNRIHKWPRGKALGGSSSINAMIYIRGNPGDYDGWQQMGCTGWGASDVLPYFMRSEDYQHGQQPGHGVGGPLPVREPAYVHPMSKKLMDACAQFGLPRRHDLNIGVQEGVGLCQFTIDRGARMSTARTFLRQAAHRPNLDIRTEALAHKILFEGKRACGIRYQNAGKIVDVAARQEVILSGGTVNSPHLLELSGIGDAARLNAIGIRPLVDLPGVGENLQDHYNAALSWQFKAGTPSINAMARGLPLLGSLMRYLLRRDGMMSVGPAHITAFAHTRPGLKSPDIQFHATPATLDGDAYAQNKLVFHKEPGLTLGACVLRPESRGSIHAKSADPQAYPDITANYLKTQTDQETMVDALKQTREIMAQPAIAPFVEKERDPGAAAQNDADLLAFARETGTTIFHPVGTCAMGPADDKRAVLTLDLKVKGVQGLRVADASIMPRLVSGNTNAPAIMIGEKAADLILGKTPPAAVAWPCHGEQPSG